MNRTDTRTVDNELLGRLLLAVEATAHRGGWDAPPALYVLYDWHEQDTERHYRELLAGRRGAPQRCGRYAAQSAVPDEALDGNAAHAVFRMALNLTHAAADLVAMFVGSLRQPGFLGLALQCEAWMRTCADADERKRLGKVRFADVPGSKEIRSVYAADIAGGFHGVMRVRGEKPSLTSPGEADEVEGSIPESLAVTVAVVAGLDVPELKNAPSGWEW